MRNELEQVRDWAEARIKAGDVPDWSWPQHVKLIEAVDAMLHDMSVVNDSARPARRLGRALQLVDRDSERHAYVHAVKETKQKAGAMR